MARTFKMYLDDVKVSKTFGLRPHLGKLLPFTKKTSAGMKWQEFGKKWVENEINVNHTVVLNKIEPGLYEVTVHDAIYEKTCNWLLEKCGPTLTSHNDVAEDWLKANTLRKPKKGKKKRAPRGPKPRWYGKTKYA